VSELGENVFGLDGEAGMTATGRSETSSRSPGILKATFTVVALTIVGRTLGLIKGPVLAWIFGADASFDALVVALFVPTMFFSFVRIPLRACFIPFFSEKLENEGEESAWQLANVFNSGMVLVFVAATALCIVFSPALAWIIAPRFGDVQHALAARMTRITSLSVLFLGLSVLATNIWHCYKRFAIPASVRMVNHVVVITALVLLSGHAAPEQRMYWLAWAVVAGALARPVVQAGIILKKKRFVRFRIDFRDPVLSQMAVVAFPLIIGSAGAKLDSLVDKMFASTLFEGVISVLFYAEAVASVPREIFLFAIPVVLFPFFSSSAGRGDHEEIGKKLSTALRFTFFFMFPMAVGLFLLRVPLVTAMYQRGEFDAASTSLTAAVLPFYAIGISFMAAGQLIPAVFYSMKNTRTPVAIGLFRVVLKIGLCLLLIGPMSYKGLVLATSISHIVKLVLLVSFVPNIVWGDMRAPMLKSAARSLLASAIMAPAVYGTQLLIRPFCPAATFSGAVAEFAVCVAIGAAAYFVIQTLFRSEEVTFLFRTATRAVAGKVRRKS